jgi:hypothetical protein
MGSWWDLMRWRGGGGGGGSVSAWVWTAAPGLGKIRFK